jgi:hypothetical protein
MRFFLFRRTAHNLRVSLLIGTSAALSACARQSAEHGEFTEGAAMLREAIASEPADFKAKVESALAAAVDASAALGKFAASSDDADKIAATHAAFAAKVKTVIELFPEDVRTKPRQPKAKS